LKAKQRKCLISQAEAVGRGVGGLPGLVALAGKLLAVRAETLVDAAEASVLRGRVGAVAPADAVAVLVDALGRAGRIGGPFSVATVYKNIEAV